MTRDTLHELLETMGDFVASEYPLVAGILFVLSGLTLTGEEELLAIPALKISEEIQKRNKTIL